MNSIKLMSIVKEMNEEIEGFDPFHYGGALNYKGANIEKIIERVIEKKEAGAKYLLTQPIYSQEDVDRVIEIREKTGIKILGGILPLVSYKNARFINNEFAGISIPEEVIHCFHAEMTREEAEKIGIEISVKTAKILKEVLDGIYFMTPFNRATMIGKILKKIK